jgi:hypothetical protein
MGRWRKPSRHLVSHPWNGALIFNPDLTKSRLSPRYIYLVYKFMNKTRSSIIQKFTAALTVLILLTLSAANALAAGTNLVIVEAYGGGGNGGSTYKNDFIGLFNRGSNAVDVTGWSVQYVSATGSGTWAVTPLTATNIPAGGYYLVQEAQGAGGTVDLPTPDATGTIAMGATGFKVALVANTTALVGANPTGTGGSIVDFVGASGTANGFEGTGPAPAPANALSVQRTSSGCTDTDVNTNDFVAAAPNPRNSSTPLHSCAIVIAPVISAVSPSSLTTNAGYAVTFTVSLSQGDSPLFYQWYTQSTDGNTSTPIAGATNSSLSFPSVLLANSTNYVVVVTNNALSANSVTSSPANLTVVDPAINLQPASQIVIPNGSAQFHAIGAGTGISYQWYFCASPSDNSQITTPVADGALAGGAVASGSTSNILTITNVTGATPPNYALVVTGTYGSVTSSVVTLTVSSTAVPLAFWNFNGIFDATNPAPYQGIGTASAVSVDAFVQPTRDGNDITPEPNTAWGTQNYPSPSVSNKQAGVQFNVSTVGARHIKVSFDLRGTTTASKYQRLQYTTNGTTWLDYPTSGSIGALQAGTYNSFSYDLTGFAGVANNPNFGIRIVPEFENTARYGNTNNANYVGINGGYSGGGTLSYDLVQITGDAIVGSNKQPIVGTITNLTVSDLVSTNVNVTVSDDITPAGSLTADAASLDPSASLSFTAANTAGNVKLSFSVNLGISSPLTVPILVTVTDGGGEFTVTSFLLTITPANAIPVINGLISTNMLTNTSITIPFTVTDDHTPATSITPTVSSGNTTLVPNDVSHLSLGGSGTNRTLVITPAAGQSGVVPITVSASDAEAQITTKAFVVVVRPNTNVLLIDNFDYDTNGPIIDVSGGYWGNHSGTLRQMKVGSGVLTNDNVANSEDVNAPLIGAPYLTNSPVSLYATFTLHYLTLPTGTNGSYFAHFKDNTTFGFFGRVFASTNNAAPGNLRLGIGNSSQGNAITAQFPQDLATNVDYTVVVRIQMANGFCSLWVNPTNETTSPVATDTTVVTNLANVYQYAFRESGGGGIVTLDNLKVGTSFAAVTGITNTTTAQPLAPVIGGVSLGGPGNTNIIITGTNNNGTTAGTYVVLTSTNVALPLSNWTAVSTQSFNADGSLNFTNPVSGPQKYYILEALP